MSITRVHFGYTTYIVFLSFFTGENKLYSFTKNKYKVENLHIEVKKDT